MPQPTVRIVARLISFPDKVEQTKAVLLGLLELTRQEIGCLQYDLLQNQEDPTDFTFVEDWESHDAIDKHLDSDHIKAALAHFPDLIAEGPDIRRYFHIA